MADIEDQTIAGYRARADAYSDRSVWGIIALNAAALLGISNIIASSPEPDQTLTALLIPTWLFVIGASSAGAGSLFQLRLLRREAASIQAMKIYADAVEYVVSVSGDERSAAYAKGSEILRMLVPGEEIMEGLPPERRFDAMSRTFRQRYRRRAKLSGVLEMISMISVGLGIGLFVAAFAVISWGSLNGVRLVERPPSNSAANIDSSK